MIVSQRIAIIGAGFSGSAVAIMLGQYATHPLHIILYDKSGTFGRGEAYKTPYPWHILNVRACDMSLYESDPSHFVRWVSARIDSYPEIDLTQPIDAQFLPRYIYHHYLKNLLAELKISKHITIEYHAAEVIDIEEASDRLNIITQQARHEVDKVIFALGNATPTTFPFPIQQEKHSNHAWDYQAIEKIPAKANVLIVGMGLSMIDTVLSLSHRSHLGEIYTVSRHGLLPLAHDDEAIEREGEQISDCHASNLHDAIYYLRRSSNWRLAINGLRKMVPALWQQTNIKIKKQFLRHLVTYWNIHRHRVPNKVAETLYELIKHNQLFTMAGRVISIKDGVAEIGVRHSQQIKKINIDWVVNAMGPTSYGKHSVLIKNLISRGSIQLDPLGLGLTATATGKLYNAANEVAKNFFTLGPPVKGILWECTAVPEIRHQAHALTMLIMDEIVKEEYAK